MIKEAYVSFEVAKLLKEKGFDGELATHMFYSEFDQNIHPVMEIGLVKSEDVYYAPTHQMALAWLREKDVIIEFDYNDDEDCEQNEHWGFSIYSNSQRKVDFATYPTYEDAVEAALNYALTNLI